MTTSTEKQLCRFCLMPATSQLALNNFPVCSNHLKKSKQNSEVLEGEELKKFLRNIDHESR